MTPVHRIAKTMAEDRILRKMARNTATSWRENEAKARKRAEELKRK